MAPRKASAAQTPKKKSAGKKATASKKAVDSSTKTSAPKSGTESPSPASKPAALSKVLVKKKPTPVSFSLEDAQSALEERKSRQTSEAPSVGPTAIAEAPVTPKKTVVTDQPVERRKHQAASLADILGFNPAQKRPETELDEETVPKKWLKYYRLLIELRNEVKNELDLHTTDTLKRSSREDSGDLSGYGQHQADAATDSFDRDFALSILSAEQDALYEIEEAIKRIKNGSYGLCEVKGEPIPKERLAVVPFTRFSIEGQREFEKNRRRKTERGGAFADSGDAVSLAGEDDGDD